MKPLYTKGNAAKQWIFEDIDKRYGSQGIRILDLCCGTGAIWKTFFETHPHINYTGIDFDRVAIQKARNTYKSCGDRVTFADGDAQVSRAELADVVTAFSAIEHVYDKEALLKTVFQSLVPGGVAYLNYDAGHFRSRDIRERFMVPVSQVLARLGFQGSFMKKVDDAQFMRLAESIGLYVVESRKHNAYCLKTFMRGANDDAVRSWYEFEDRLGKLYSQEELDTLLWSTTLVLRKL